MAATINLQLCADCHCLAARRNAREITRLFDERLRPHGLRTTQFSVLALLALGGGASVNRVADALGVERTTLTRSTTILERRGWGKNDAPPHAPVGPPRPARTRQRKTPSVQAALAAS